MQRCERCGGLGVRSWPRLKHGAIYWDAFACGCQEQIDMVRFDMVMSGVEVPARDCPGCNAPKCIEACRWILAAQDAEVALWHTLEGHIRDLHKRRGWKVLDRVLNLDILRDAA